MKNPKGTQYAHFVDECDAIIHIDRQDDGFWRLYIDMAGRRTNFPEQFCSPEQAELLARQWIAANSRPGPVAPSDDANG